MKFSPTVPFALVLAAGIAGAAAAQTTATPGAASNAPQPIAPDTQSPAAYSQPQTGTTQPQANYGQAQPALEQTGPATAPGKQGSNQPQANPTTPMQPAAGQAQNTSDQVRTAQEQLQAAGLYKGPTDGLMDPDTRAAIANFQQQNGMRRTATLDQPTLDRLMANRTAGSGSSTPAARPMPNAAQGSTAPPAGAGETTTGNDTGQSTSQ